MKFRLLFFSLFLSINAFGQRDTIIYFSELDCPLQTITNAFHYEKLVNESNGQLSLTEFNKLQDKWQKSPTVSIRKQSDTSFSMIAYGRTIRFFHKIDSGFVIKDYVDSKLTKTGFSKLVFPLIKSGVWKYYNPLTGKKETEYFYINNQIISSKYWVNDFTFYGDSIRPGDTPPLFEGGNYAMLKFIAENAQYPDEAKENNIQGRVIVKFHITSQGEIVNSKVMNIVDIALARESIRVINLTKGKWTPGKNGSADSDTFKTVPIIFTLK
jgi:TonB family protein